MNKKEILLKAIGKVKNKWEHAEYFIKCVSLINPELLTKRNSSLNKVELNSKKSVEVLMEGIARAEGFLTAYFKRKGVKGNAPEALKAKDIFKYLEKH